MQSYKRTCWIEGEKEVYSIASGRLRDTRPEDKTVVEDIVWKVPAKQA